MKCVICRNGETRPGLAEKAFSHDGMTLVVKDVPAEVCENCGERYFDEDVTRQLLEIVRTAAAEGVVVDVRRYIAA
jgi:YgiT-type zinc finger domain-containing protein